jgi:hypothetical protein
MPREEPVDIHDLDLGSERGGDRVDFDPEFEDPFADEPRIRRGSGLRDPTGSELDPPPDLDFGAPPEFGFETSGGDLVDDPDAGEGEDERDRDPERQPRRRSDPRH